MADTPLYFETPEGFVNTTAIVPNDGEYHYTYIEMTVTATGFSWYIQVDSTVTTGSSTKHLSTAPISILGMLATTGSSAAEGISVRFEKAGQFTRTTRPSWTPTYEATYNGVSPALTVIPGGTASAWATIGELADAVGAKYRWDESGGWQWDSRDYVSDARFATPALAIDDDNLVSAGFGYEGASRRSKVSTNWIGTEYVLSSSGINPSGFWNATELITVGKNSVQTFTFEVPDVQVATIEPAFRITTRPSVNSKYSMFQVVPASQVGDPAAATVTGVNVDIQIIPGGISATIANGNAFDIALWDPVSQAPFFWVNGAVVRTSTKLSATVESSAGSFEGLALSDSPWRQERSAAIAQAEAIASECALPAIVFSQQTTVGDPTRQVGDVINLQASNLMDEPVPCIIIGKDSTIDEDTLTVVPCYPPTGAVIGVTGRSEIGNDASDTTAILVA